ncbi:hypothetical protein IT402_00420 [Candidatus Nomurabacteria bacterium]|nr:hypothetical protein [Candidatus Nomurabacteria bacterium]
MKKIIFIFLLFIFSFENVFAIGSLPKENVFVSPKDAEINTPVKINALIYNNQPESITFTIEFKEGDSLVAKPVVKVVNSLAAETVSVDFKQSEEQTQINVSITSAINKQRQDLVGLHGLVGSVLIGKSVDKNKNLSMPEGKLREIFYSLKEKIEVFRKKQAIYFTNLRDSTKMKLGIKISEDALQNLTPDFANMAPTIATEEKSSENVEGLEKAELDNPMDYVTLIYSTALASLFGSVLMFYAAFFLILLLILRFIFRMFI